MFAPCAEIASLDSKSGKIYTYKYYCTEKLLCQAAGNHEKTCEIVHHLQTEKPAQKAKIID